MAYPRLTRCMPDEGRHNPFLLLHKALRFGHCRMLMDLGTQDFGAEAAQSLLQQLVGRIDLIRAVSEARHQALVAALASRASALLPGLHDDHASHMAALSELQSLVRAVNVATPRRRSLAGRSIYRCHALYSAADMARMDEDETVLLMALHAALDDEALRALEGRSFAGVAAEHVPALVRLVVPALSTAELEGLLELLSRHLEPVSYAAAVDAVLSPLVPGSSAAA